MEDSQMKIREAKEESQIKESAKQIRDKKQDIKFDVRDYPINYLVSQYEKQEFYIPLEYQRNFVWGNKDRCFFIESILMGLPIPFMFFADTDDGRIEIVDGAQRTQTLVQFCQNDLELQDLQILENSNGFLFSNLLILNFFVRFSQIFLLSSISASSNIRGSKILSFIDKLSIRQKS